MSFEPKFEISQEINNSLTSIERARGFLEAATLSEDWLKAMQDQTLVLEAHHTTHIEGTQLTLEQSEQILGGFVVEGATNAEDVKELLNYRKAFDFVDSYIKSGELLSEGLIREIHKRLVQGVRGNAAAPGDYRKIQNYVVNSATKEVIYTPPPAYDVPIMMAELVSWLGSTSSIHPVLMAGIAQFQLVHIHPFLDGNGRTARLLSTLFLYQKEYDFKRLFTISAYYDRNRADYYRAIQSVRDNDMDLTYWLRYFTEGLANQLKEVRTQGEQIIKADILLSKTVLKARAQDLVRFLISKKNASILECENALQINRRTLQRDLKQLIELGFVKELGSGPTDPTKRYQALL